MIVDFLFLDHGEGRENYINMDDIIETFNKYTGYKGRRDDDWFDRLSNRYTVIVILVFAGLITLYQLGDNPITCWCPVHFSGKIKKYYQIKGKKVKKSNGRKYM